MSVKPTYEELERYGRQADITIENLEQKLAESQREFRAADATIENLQMQLNAERESKLALAAENAGLKGACERVSMWNDFPQATLRSNGEVVPYVVAYGSNGERDYMRNIATTALKETTATSSFLAEVRAQGVEMFAAVLRRKGDDAFFDAIAEAQANAADQFADQLRKGAQS